MTGLQSITKVVKKRKLSWYGHIKRSSLPVRTIFEWFQVSEVEEDQRGGGAMTSTNGQKKLCSS